jgi:hypothetical protein
MYILVKPKTEHLIQSPQSMGRKTNLNFYLRYNNLVTNAFQEHHLSSTILLVSSCCFAVAICRGGLNFLKYFEVVCTGTARE